MVGHDRYHPDRMIVGRALWSDVLTAQERVALDPGVLDELDLRPDVLIVGGGMLGLAIAVACRGAGVDRVTIVERHVLGAGASGSAAGLLIPDAHQGTDPDALVALGRAGLQGWRDLNDAWPGTLGVVAHQWLGLDPQRPAFAANLPAAAQRLDEDDVRGLVPGLARSCGGVLLANQARINPLRAIARMALGSPSVATGVDVGDVVVRGDRVTGLVTSIGTLTSDVVVFATGGPPALPHLGCRLDGQWVKGHLLTTEPVPACLPGTVTNVATQLDDGRLLAGGTLDVDDTTPQVDPNVINAIRQELDAALPAVAAVPTSHSWCCFRPRLQDGLPVIDRVPGLANAWLTCGHYRTGILLAPATAQLLTHWITTGSRPPAAAPFSADRPASPR
jgi:glycine/D-amino acid oxidase-like deaminating enzyme